MIYDSTGHYIREPTRDAVREADTGGEGVGRGVGLLRLHRPNDGLPEHIDAFCRQQLGRRHGRGASRMSDLANKCSVGLTLSDSMHRLKMCEGCNRSTYVPAYPTF